MTSSGYNQSLALTSTGSYSSSISPLKTTYSYPLNLYSAYVIAPSLSTLSSVLAIIDRSLLTSGISSLTSLVSGLSKGRSELATRQSGWSQYAWDETIVQPVEGVTSVMETWFSYAGESELEKRGVGEYGRYLREENDGVIVDREGWATIHVPSTRPLPFVEGEPAV